MTSNDKYDPKIRVVFLRKVLQGKRGIYVTNAADIISKIKTDENFRIEFKNDPIKALESQGYHLTDFQADEIKKLDMRLLLKQKTMGIQDCNVKHCNYMAG